MDGASCCVFSGTVSPSDYSGSSCNVKVIFKRTRKEEIRPKIEVLPRGLDELRKTRKDVSQYWRCSE